MLNSSASTVIRVHLLADPVGYLRASYASWVICAKAVTKAAAHVLQCERAAASAAALASANAALQVHGCDADCGVYVE
jgi:hypothetical protein